MPAGDAAARGPASSFARPAVPACIGAIFTEGRIRTTAVRQVHIRAHRQMQPDSNPDLAPAFTFFLQKLCQSSAHRAGENTRRNKSPSHPPASKKTVLRTRSLKVEYLGKPGQVGTQPDLTYGCPSLGPSMKSCFLNIKPFPEVPRPWDCWPGGVCLQRHWELAAHPVSLSSTLISRARCVLEPLSQPLPPCSCCLFVKLRLFLCVFSLHQDLGERSGLSGRLWLTWPHAEPHPLMRWKRSVTPGRGGRAQGTGPPSRPAAAVKGRLPRLMLRAAATTLSVMLFPLIYAVERRMFSNTPSKYEILRMHYF